MWVEIKGVEKKTNLAVSIRSEFREKQSFKNWKNRGPKPTGRRPVGGPLFFQFLKDCFFRNSVPRITATDCGKYAEMLVFLCTPFILWIKFKTKKYKLRKKNLWWDCHALSRHASLQNETPAHLVHGRGFCFSSRHSQHTLLNWGLGNRRQTTASSTAKISPTLYEKWELSLT